MQLHLEVAPVAQIRLLLLHTSDIFRGGLPPDTPTTVCAAAFDALGRPLADAALPQGWASLSLVHAAHAVFNQTSEDGRCIELTPTADWHAAPTRAMLVVSPRLPASSTRLAAPFYVLLRPATPAEGYVYGLTRVGIDPLGAQEVKSSAVLATTASTAALPAMDQSASGAVNVSMGGALVTLPDRLDVPPGLVGALVLLALAGLAIKATRWLTRRPLPKLNPRAAGPSLRGPYSPRHTSPARTASAGHGAGL